MSDLLRTGRRAVADGLVRSAGVRRRLPEGTGVALTFDDGPDPESTPALLDVLDRLGAVATFFCVGVRVAAHPSIVARALAAGHRVGSHSATHPEPWSLGLRAVHADYRRGRRLLEAATGGREGLFRPPHGHLDGSGALAMRAAGLRPWLWSRDPQDWRPGMTSAQILSGLEGLASGDVVLLHDGLAGASGAPVADRSATVEAVSGLVGRIRAAGMDCVTLP